MIDEAFMDLSSTIERLADVDASFVDEEAGVRTRVTALQIETPVELCVARDEHGALRIGTTPPLYNVRTSILPSFHRLSFSAVATPNDADAEGRDGG